MSGSYMSYYFFSEAIASINDQESEEEKHRVENEARETEELQEAAHGAARSGDLELILALTPTQFEYTMAAIMRLLGMTQIQRAGGRGHFGVDIKARDASGRTVLIRCKRRARTKKIGSPEIEKFIGTAHIHHRADLKLFVTTSEFTDHAQALAHQHGIQLMNGSDIEDLARRQRGTTPQ
jgi:restriction system protein